MKQADEDRLFRAQAEICKTFANPWRLRIVETLGDDELAVWQIAEAIDIPKSNLSQHLAIMRDKGVVESRREGGQVYYRLTSVKILKACRMMREVLMDGLTRVAELVRADQPG